MTAKIQLSGVHKRFGSKIVLDGVDLAVQPAESMVIIGGSGTGKSVMIKCILGLIRPESGSITVDGAEVIGLKGRALADHQARFGMLFQGGALFDSEPVWRNVAFRHLHGKRRLPAAEARALAVERLRRVGLGPETADKFPAELSGGMQKRVGLARAIAASPEISFFDDPSNYFLVVGVMVTVGILVIIFARWRSWL
jgi:phospholipid/cholesterol/gamma-HCH transport system ATP-binding protein